MPKKEGEKKKRAGICNSFYMRTNSQTNPSKILIDWCHSLRKTYSKVLTSRSPTSRSTNETSSKTPLSSPRHLSYYSPPSLPPLSKPPLQFLLNPPPHFLQNNNPPRNHFSDPLSPPPAPSLAQSRRGQLPPSTPSPTPTTTALQQHRRHLRLRAHSVAAI